MPTFFKTAIRCFASIAGQAFRTDVIPEAVLWYTGEAIEDDDEEDDDENVFEDADEDEEEVRTCVVCSYFYILKHISLPPRLSLCPANPSHRNYLLPSITGGGGL